MLPRPIRMLFATALIMSTASFAAIAEELVIDAYSAWDFTGQLVPSSETESRMVGTFQGIVFVEEEEGLRDGGVIACTADVLLNAAVSRLGGDGSCVIMTATGPRVYGKYDCEGTIGLGCKGVFYMQSGTGRFEGIKGQGDFILRAVIVSDLSEYHGNVSENTISGLAIWQNLRVLIPDAADTGGKQSEQARPSQ